MRAHTGRRRHGGGKAQKNMEGKKGERGWNSPGGVEEFFATRGTKEDKGGEKEGERG